MVMFWFIRAFPPGGLSPRKRPPKPPNVFPAPKSCQGGKSWASPKARFAWATAGQVDIMLTSTTNLNNNKK